MPLPWFRRKKETEREQASPAAATPAPQVEAPTVVVAAPGEADDGQSSATRKRRRGTRGGRNRRKKPVDATANGDGATTAVAKSGTARTTAAKPAAGTSTAAERKPSERKPRERQQPSRRRQPPKRAPLPKAKRELLISVDAGEKRVAVLEDDQVAEVYLERPERRSIAGNIYLGVVDNVLPGMEAAFVEIGLEKNGFLYVDEIVGPELEGRKSARKIQDLIQKGQTVLVQAVKDPMKTKGARLTTEVSLAGRFVVYVPHSEGLGVSRRLEDDERTRLKAILKDCAPKEGGVIVRTAAEGASPEDIERDLDFLQRLWKTIEVRAKGSQAPALIYQEAELPLRVVRDLFTGDFEKLLVDHDRTYRRIVGYLKKTSPHMADRVVRWKEREPLMDTFGVEREIKSTLSRRVDLPSGGYLIFDYAEAFTVIDVNTGRFVGSRSKKSGARLEDTITKNNLEAVKEVVRQLRLRDIGGIIVIDFIDMANPKNRQQVEEALRVELERDRTKTYVVEISPLGLVEMTRQNVTDGPREVMTKKCPTCGGDGIVVSEHTAAVDVERRLRALVTPGSRSKAFKVELNSKIVALVVGSAGERLRELEETTKRRFFLVGKDDLHLDHFKVLDQGLLEKVAPQLPVDVGAELDVKPVEVGLHDSRSAVAKLDGMDISIGNAAKLVGRKVKIRITAVAEGIAWAELLSPVEASDAPLTAEAEAEKPTRARRPSSRKTSTTAGDEDVEDVDEDVDIDSDIDVEDEPGEEIEDGAVGEIVAEKPAVAGPGEIDPATGLPKKKRTRRGTRGGRNRKRPPVGDGTATLNEAAEDATAVEDELAEVVDERAELQREAALENAVEGLEPEPESGEAGDAPVIHLPDPSLGSDAAGEVRKRTRRGSRGGRNRRKKPAGAVADGAVAVVEEDEESVEHAEPELAVVEDEVVIEEEAVVEEPAAEDEAAGEEEASDGEWTYTPMSDWGLDDRR